MLQYQGYREKETDKRRCSGENMAWPASSKRGKKGNTPSKGYIGRKDRQKLLCKSCLRDRFRCSVCTLTLDFSDGE